MNSIMEKKIQKKEEQLTPSEIRFADELRNIVLSNLRKAYAAINYTQVNTNWNLGRRIVEEEQHGEARAEYGKRVIAIASRILTEEFGRGYSETNCKSFRRFYLEFQGFTNWADGVCPSDMGKSADTVCPNQINHLELLSWSGLQNA